MTGYTQNGSTVSSWESGCTHYGITEVMTLGKARIWAGSKYQAEHEYGWALAITLLGHSYTQISAPVRLNEEAKVLLPPHLADWKPVPVLSVDWPDGSVPPMDAQWWDTLFQALHDIQGDVVIYCQGGHGRTGTALSILAAKAGYMKKGCPVAWVRKRYCKNSVETTSQMKYIHAMSGVKPLSLPSHVLKQMEREKEAKANPPQAQAASSVTSSAVTATTVGQPPSGQAFGAKDDEWVRDPLTGILCRKSELSQDWEGSHWGG